jgi:hypothetical protein
MDFVVKNLLDQATDKGWFERQDNKCLEIWLYAVGLTLDEFMYISKLT